MVTIATWNVNSLRVRLPHVLDFLQVHQPDVLALQETKLPDADFPIDAFKEIGLNVVFSGQRTYNGVAIISRAKVNDVITDFPDFVDPQRRLLMAVVQGICILNIYVPNGESVESEKYQYKLNWLSHLTHFIKKQLKKYPDLVVLGDFNIAPKEIDVRNPESWEGKVLFSQPERQAFQALLDLGLVDLFRAKNPTEQAYSWWDYRMNAFKRNLGLRIDHILCSQPLYARSKSGSIDKAPRALQRPSDHAPVIAQFA